MREGGNNFGKKSVNLGCLCRYNETLNLGYTRWRGIADHLFMTGKAPGTGMISKREVRLAILSLMQIDAMDVVWDIGAGCDSDAIEMAYWQPTAIEYHAQRLVCLAESQQCFGVVKNLAIIEGKAPEVLIDLPLPDKMFIGGSDGQLSSLLDKAWNSLPDHGVVVVSAVADRSKQQLHAFAARCVGVTVESVELAVKRGWWEAGDIRYDVKLPMEII